MKSFNNKHLIILSVILLLTSVYIKVRYDLSYRKIPKDKLVEQYNNILTDRNFENDIVLLIIPERNAYSQAVLELLKEEIPMDKNIFVFTKNREFNGRENNLILIDDFEVDNITRLFDLTEEFPNWILEYDRDGFLISTNPLTPSFHKKVKDIFKHTDYKNYGNIIKHCEDLQSIFSLKEDNVYYLTESIRSNCLCYAVLNKLESDLCGLDKKLHLILDGEWTDRDVSNFVKERNNKIEACRSNNNTKEIIANWKKETGRDDFTVIIVKEDTLVRTFPLLSQNDYGIWFNFRKSEFDNLFKQ